MATAQIPVDLFNPGQVFACLGFMEVAEVLLGEAEAGFDWSDPAQTRFLLRSPGETDPIEAGLEFVGRAHLRAVAPNGSEHSTEKWKIPTRINSVGDSFPTPPPLSPAALPALLESDGRAVWVDSWGDSRSGDLLTTRRDNVKFWAGAAGYPGVAFLQDSIRAAGAQMKEARCDPFSLSAPQSSSLRFDWRRDYIPIDIGFSLNEHTSMQPRGYPLVEVFAAIGLEHARPDRVNKLLYRYAVAGRAERRRPEGSALLPPMFLRAVLGGAEVPLPTRTFAMQLDWPGQKDQARCITTVTEESTL